MKTEDPFDNMIHAPDFYAGSRWLGIKNPLSLEDLRGNIVLLHFMTYSCINCFHTNRLLEGLIKRHSDDPFIVIGIHSSKFDREKDPFAVEMAMARYNIRHPVVMDPSLKLWREYSIRAWPTLVLIDSRGRIASISPGEPDPTSVAYEVSDLLNRERQRGYIRETNHNHKITPIDYFHGFPLRFPGSIQLLPDGLMAIADSGHNRIIITESDGRLMGIVGSGERGLEDGVYHNASFDFPQGMGIDLINNILYVADTGNNCIRAVDLKEKAVRTVAGTGELGRTRHQIGKSTRALTTSLRSPWDLEITDRGVVIAMAGSHQLWLLQTDREEISVLSGTGNEVLLDGPANRCGFAQPSAVCSGMDRNTLIVLDAEASAVRKVSLETGQVSTLIGRGLFTFGDQDGIGTEVRLQHPLGISSGASGFAIADTYNHKIKLLYPLHRTMTTLPIGNSGESASLEQDARGVHRRDLFLDEPEGLAETPDGRIVVADTNNHRIIITSAGGSERENHQLQPLTIKGLTPP